MGFLPLTQQSTLISVVEETAFLAFFFRFFFSLLTYKKKQTWQNDELTVFQDPKLTDDVR